VTFIHHQAGYFMCWTYPGLQVLQQELRQATNPPAGSALKQRQSNRAWCAFQCACKSHHAAIRDGRRCQKNSHTFQPTLVTPHLWCAEEDPLRCPVSLALLLQGSLQLDHNTLTAAAAADLLLHNVLVLRLQHT
jgi:hypothetical protein